MGRERDETVESIVTDGLTLYDRFEIILRWYCLISAADEIGRLFFITETQANTSGIVYSMRLCRFPVDYLVVRVRLAGTAAVRLCVLVV